MTCLSHSTRETEGLRDSEFMKTNNNTSTKRLFAKIVYVRSFYIRKKMVATAIEMWTFSTFRKTLEKKVRLRAHLNI